MTDKAETYTGPIHYFASNSFGWGTGPTREAAIDRCLQACGLKTIKDTIKRMHKEGQAGFYVWSCKVHGKQDAHYRIGWYMPEGIDISDSLHHDVTHITAKELAYTSRKEDTSSHRVTRA